METQIKVIITLTKKVISSSASKKNQISPMAFMESKVMKVLF